MKKGDLK